MDQADSELRGTIKQIWPIQAKKMIDLLVPPKNMLNTGKMTVGKIYAGVLLLETWRNNKCIQLECDAPDLQDRKSHEIQEAYIDDGHLHPGHDPRGAHRRSPSIQYDYREFTNGFSVINDGNPIYPLVADVVQHWTDQLVQGTCTMTLASRIRCPT